MSVIVTTVQVGLAIGAVVALIRAIGGPTLADRIVALDLMLLLLAAGIAAEGARSGTTWFFPVAIVVALVAFAGTVLVARFIEWRDTR